MRRFRFEVGLVNGSGRCFIGLCQADRVRKLGLFAASFAVVASLAQEPSERVALVVGNASYSHAPPLTNPRNDAEDMAAVLRRLGFSVAVGTDLGDAEMEAYVRAFSRQARAAEVALFFYAGHGLQVDGVNYLVPTDARLAAESDLPFEAVALDLVLKGMGGGTNLAFLDACRDNPFARAWRGAGRSTSVGRGLSPVSKPGTGGLFIAFATDPDSTAEDGDGRNSPFTAALKEHIETAGLEVNRLLTQVRRTVLADTRQAQRPWSNSSLNDEFYFVQPSPTGKPDTPSPAGDAPDPAAEMWLQIRGTTDVQLLERYLAIYPNSRYRPSAQARLDELRGWRIGERFRDCARCPEMVVVPAGSFLMGSPESERKRDEREGPVHQVRIAAPFAVGVYEVTFAEWDACEDAGGCRGHLPDDADWGRGRRPVIFVSWEDARAYVGWLSEKTGKRYRLPSESEWEYAARAKTRTSRPWGDSQSGQCSHANGGDAFAKRVSKYPNWAVVACDDGHVNTAPVGRYEGNAWGLHDVLGNVWEWTEDCWNKSYEGAPTDGSAWGSGDCSTRVLRGGAWTSNPWRLRSASRLARVFDDRSFWSGFRVARTLNP